MSVVCGPKIGVDSSTVNLPQSSQPEENASSRAPKAAILFMILIIIMTALTALYANLQRLQRGKIEAVTITPASLLPAPSQPGKHFQGARK
jgi:hypothetical protein